MSYSTAKVVNMYEPTNLKSIFRILWSAKSNFRQFKTALCNACKSIITTLKDLAASLAKLLNAGHKDAELLLPGQRIPTLSLEVELVAVAGNELAA